MGVVHVRRVRLYGSVFMATQAALRDVVRIDRLLLGGHETLAAFVAASPRLALTSIALAVLGGLLAPAYAIATGALVQAVSNQQPATWPLIALAAIFTVQRTLDPIREEIGLALWPRVDERLNDRIMSAVSRPAGLQELESPAVLIDTMSRSSRRWSAQPRVTCPRHCRQGWRRSSAATSRVASTCRWASGRRSRSVAR